MTAPPPLAPTPTGTHSTGPNGATERVSRADLAAAGRELREMGYAPTVYQVADFARWRAANSRASVPEVREWLTVHAPRRRKLKACDQRIGGPNWRLSS